jgi:hypothetical protein
VVRGFDEEQAPTLDVPELLPPGVERLGVEVVLAADMTEVAPEAAVPEARAHVGVARHEVAAEALVVVDRARLAERSEARIRIVDEGGIGRVEADGDL